jgi:spore germination protein GerM
MSRGLLAIVVIAIVGVLIGTMLVSRVPRLTSQATPRAAAAPAPTAPAPPGRKIKARLFYVADDGMRLTSVERDIAYGEGAVEQAREIVAAQIAPVVEPLVSAVPPGTTLRAVFLAENGAAYVDLSRELASAHPGGTLNELLTVYTIVNALTVNLPAVTSVQVLVDGKEVDTLAGHIDLRQPLSRNLAWVQVE